MEIVLKTLAIVLAAVICLSLCGCYNESNNNNNNDANNEISNNEPIDDTDEHKHSYVETVIAPTCVDEGYTLHVCSCGDEYVDTVVSTAKHSYNSGETVQKATCTENGKIVYTCKNCGDNYEVVTSSTGHKWQQATCSTPKTCKSCNATDGEVKPHDIDKDTGICKACGIETYLDYHEYLEEVPDFRLCDSIRYRWNGLNLTGMYNTGHGFYLYTRNISEKTIKYATIYYSTYNRVGDVIHSSSNKITGPIEPDEIVIFTDDDWTIWDGAYHKTKRVKIEYMDGTTITVIFPVTIDDEYDDYY